MQALGIKSGSTFASDWTDSIEPSLVYGGTASYEREGVHVGGGRTQARLR